jgi:hypothetical protein
MISLQPPLKKKPHRSPLGLAAILAIATALVACQDPSSLGVSNFITTHSPFAVSSGNAIISGNASIPTSLISNGAGNLISNGAGNIIAGNTARYHLASVGVSPIANAIVYLTTPQEQFFVGANNQPLAANTDAQGHYQFANGLPKAQTVIVNVMLNNNRREVGFTVAQAGQNVVNVSLASTYVTEFLRLRAGQDGKQMGEYDLSQLPALAQLTQKALDAGDLALPDLGIGAIANLDQAYALAIGLNKDGLGDAWAKILGQRVLALTTYAGTGQNGSSGDGKQAIAAQFYLPKSIARDSAGNTYVSDERNNAVRKIAPDGTISTFVGTGQPAYGGDNGPANKASLDWPRAVIVGPDNALYIADTLNARIRLVDLATNIITTFAGVGGADGFSGDGGPAINANLAGPRGFAFDSTGALIFSDTWNSTLGSWHHIRRIDKNGIITSLIGVDGQNGFNGDGKPGRQTLIDYTNQLAVDKQDNIIFTDARNNRIRRYDAKTQLVSTLVGNGTAGTAGDGGPALSAQLNNPYGVALDGKGDMFISEQGSRRIRLVTPDGNIRTIAGGGTFVGDGESLSVALVEPHDLYLESDGDLLLADARGGQVRRLWLKWGF